MKLQSMIPMLGVSNVPRALDFYRETLHFELVRKYETEGRCLWALARSGGVELMFYLEPAKAPEGTNSVYLNFYPDNVIELHATLQAKGYKVSPLRVTFYHMREFELTDPDGYEWLVGQPTDEPPTDGS